MRGETRQAYFMFVLIHVSFEMIGATCALKAVVTRERGYISRSPASSPHLLFRISSISSTCFKFKSLITLDYNHPSAAMRILFLCTAHNSLSQRLYLELSASKHNLSIEYALSDNAMIDAVTLFDPDLVLCPFLTTRVPKEIYSKVLTLIVHPGPPGDAGPSAIDWLLMGDDGSFTDADEALRHLNSPNVRSGRTHWGVTVLEAIEDFDAGPVWAFEQYPIDIDEPGLTKSELYRGPVTRAAVVAVKSAICKVQRAINGRKSSVGNMASTAYSPKLSPEPTFKRLSLTDALPFQGGKTRMQSRPCQSRPQSLNSLTSQYR